MPMRIGLFMLVAACATAGLAFAAPSASAISDCVDHSPGIVVQDCSYYLVCVNRQTTNGYEECNVAVDYPCRTCVPW